MDISLLTKFIFSPKILEELKNGTPEFKHKTLIDILSTPTHTRSGKNMMMLKFLVRSFPFVRENILQLGESTFAHFCQAVSFEEYKAGDIVFGQGDSGDRFYIILSGIVSVLTFPYNDDYSLEVAKLDIGMSFGELALIRKQPRSATIKCLESCQFLVLQKADYLQILGKVEEKKLEEIVSFLHSISLFSSWTKKSLEKLSYHFKSKVYHRNQTVYKEGDIPEEFYIIKKGEFEFSKKQHTPKNQNQKHETFSIGMSMRKVALTPLKITPKVALLSVGEIFGDEELLKGISRTLTCTCVVRGELMCMKKSDFFGRIRADDSIKFLQDSSNIRENIRADRLKYVPSIENSFSDIKNYKTDTCDRSYKRSKAKLMITSVRYQIRTLNSKPKIKNLTLEETGKVKSGQLHSLTPIYRLLNETPPTLKSFSPHFRHENYFDLEYSKCNYSRISLKTSLTPIPK